MSYSRMRVWGYMTPVSGMCHLAWRMLDVPILEVSERLKWGHDDRT